LKEAFSSTQQWIIKYNDAELPIMIVHSITWKCEWTSQVTDNETA